MTFLEISGIFSSHMGNITMLCILKARQQTTFIGLACVRKREENIHNIQLTHSWGMCLHCVRWLTQWTEKATWSHSARPRPSLCSVISNVWHSRSVGKGIVINSQQNTHTKSIAKSLLSGDSCRHVGCWWRFPDPLVWTEARGWRRRSSEQSVRRILSSHVHQTCYQESTYLWMGRSKKQARLKVSADDVM